jgi:hypothetical protein
MKKPLIIAALAFSAAGLKAEETFFQASLTPDLAVQPRTTEIRGLSLNIWGENPQHGIALGFINGSSGDSSGFSWGLVNYADSYTGVQWAIANASKSSFVGWQAGLINYSQGSFNGLQLGLVNYAEDLHGVQIGLANIAENNQWFNEFPDKLATVFPIVNWSF